MGSVAHRSEEQEADLAFVAAGRRAEVRDDDRARVEVSEDDARVRGEHEVLEAVGARGGKQVDEAV